MGKDLLKKLLPHIVAVLVFLVVALLFCKPALQGKALSQGDTLSWRAMAQGSFEYKEKNGHFPIWTTNMFSGMPGYQIAAEGPTIYTGYLHTLFTLGLSKPFHFFFLACICFYFLAMCLRVHTVLGILGALAFAYASYSPIIIGAGHETKMMSLAYVPALLGAVILLYEKKYVWGFALTALFTFLQLIMNHQQISYYTFFIIAALSIGYLVNSIKTKTVPGALKSVGLAALAGLIGVLGTFHTILPNYEYSKESKRGGQLIIDSTKTNSEKTAGLQQDYAFQWSLGKVETGAMMIPGLVSYGAVGYEPKEDKSATIKFLQTSNPPSQKFDVNSAANAALGNLYWGGQHYGTVGPSYMGAIICLLAFLSFFLLKSYHRWWILGMSVFAILLAWGKNLPGFNGFMFDHFPLYNKFRAPTTTLAIIQTLLPVAAILLLQQLLFTKYTVDEKKRLMRNSLFITGGVVLLSLALYLGAGYTDENTTRTRLFNSYMNAGSREAADSIVEQIRAAEPGSDNDIMEAVLQQVGPDGATYGKNLVKAVKAERKSIAGGSLVRTLIFMLLALGVLVAFWKFNFNPLIGAIVILALVAGDQISFAGKYLGPNSYVDGADLETSEFPKTLEDVSNIVMENKQQEQYMKLYYGLLINTKKLVKDNNFRVHNLLDDPWNKSTGAYYLPLIGGYHPAKIGRYDDLIQYQLGNRNPAVLDMLNTKYILQRNDSTGVPEAFDRRTNLGNCWFIKAIKPVKSDTEEMLALSSFNPAETVFINESFKGIYGKQMPQFDSAATIKQTVFDNDHITYESNAATPQFAVFSEVYYSKGWKVYIDGNEVPYCRVNYLLRGLPVPAGKHKIEFIFKPASIKTSFMIATIFGNLCLVLLAGAAYWQFRNPKKAAPLAAKA